MRVSKLPADVMVLGSLQLPSITSVSMNCKQCQLLAVGQPSGSCTSGKELLSYASIQVGDSEISRACLQDDASEDNVIHLLPPLTLIWRSAA